MTMDPSAVAAGSDKITSKQSASFPLTHRQSLFWLDEQLYPAAPYHHVVLTVGIKGHLDRAWFRQVFQETVAAIDQFRLTFSLEDGEPRQSIRRDHEATLEDVDLSSDPSGLDRWVQARCQRRFDLSKRGYDAALITLGENRHAFCLTLHHILSDGTSVSLFLNDLSARYDGRPVPVRPSYALYAAHEQAYRASPKAERAMRYYAKKLDGASTPLRLYGRAHEQRSVGVERSVLDAGAERWRRLSAVVQDPRVEFLDASMSRLVAIASVQFAYLYRVTGARSLVIGSPIPNRSLDFVDTCGLLMEQIFLAVKIDEGETFESLVAKVRSELFATLRHGQQCVSDRGVHYSTLNLLRVSVPKWSDFELDVKLVAAHATGISLPNVGDTRDTFSVHILDFERDDRFQIGFDFHRDTFDAELQERAKRHFLAMLDGLLTDLATPLDSIPLVGEQERSQLLALGRGPTLEAAPEDPIARLVRTAQERAEHPAIVFGAEELRYGELIAKVGQLAARLRELGVGLGSKVGICVPRGPDEPLAMLAAWAAQGAYVPLDPTHPSERIRLVLEDAAPDVLVTHASVAAGLDIPDGVRVLLLDQEREGLLRLTPHIETRVRAEQLAYVLFTSGSTGRPKGVAVSRRAIANFLRSMAHTPGMTESDRLLAVTTITFDIAGLELHLPLWVGATVQIADRETVLDAARLKQLLEGGSISMMQATPTTFRLLLEAGYEGSSRRVKFLCGGEAMSPELARALSTCGALWNMYGPTETTVWSTVKEIRPDSRVTVGRPIDETQIYILDARAQLLPQGVIGELCIGGLGVAEGYLLRPELTAEKFIVDPFDPKASRIYRTGDLARFLPNGEIECLGRVDHQVKIRGFRIELGEIESCLRSVPEVRDAVVTALTRAGGEPQLVAYFVGDCEPSVLRERARQRLPVYMHPALYVPMAEFPLNTNGKVDRKLLPVPSEQHVVSEEAVAAVTDRESQMAELFEEILGLSRVSVERDFFALGGDSARVLALRRRIQQTFGVELPLNVLFESSSVRQLVKMLDSQIDPNLPAFVCLKRGDPALAPLVCLVGVALYSPLAQSLQSRRSVYGIHIPYVDQSSTTTVQSIAAGYVSLIRERFPEGPYHLLGLCFGGLIAFEVAKQLQATGARVETLAILDAALPRGVRLDIANGLRKFVHLLSSQPKSLATRVWRRAQGLLRESLAAGAERNETKDLEANPRDVALEGPLAAAVVVDYDRHASVYQGQAILFRTEDRTDSLFYPAVWDLGWRSLIAELEVQAVPSTHLDMLKTPAVLALSRRLDRAFNE